MNKLLPYKFRLGIMNCSTHTIPQFVEEVKLLLSNKSLKPRTLLCVNAHIYNIASRDASLLDILNTARIVTADGISINWASRFFGEVIPERCNMTEAFRAFLQANNMPESYGILAGVNKEEARAAAHNIEKTSSHCHIVRTISGFLDDEDYKQIFMSFPDIDFIFLGMSTPKTEKISKIAGCICPQAIVWGIGAGTIKIFAGTMKEASIFWRRNGLQWLHRLCSEPVTLWQRYVLGNPRFIYNIFIATLRAKQNSSK